MNVLQLGGMGAMTTSARPEISRFGIPVACRACGTHIVYPEACPSCGLDPVLCASTDLGLLEPAAGEAGWYRRHHDPVDIERYWNGTAWTREIRGEKVAWLERLVAMPAEQRTAYTEDQIDLLTVEVERIRDLITPTQHREREGRTAEQVPTWTLSGMTKEVQVSLPVAPVGTRVVALLIDLALVGLIGVSAAWILGGAQVWAVLAGTALLGLAYLAGGWGDGATLGMRTVEIRLADARTGRSIGWRRGLLRAVVSLLGLPLLVGLWSPLLDRGRYRRSLADAACRAVMVRTS